MSAARRSTDQLDLRMDAIQHNLRTWQCAALWVIAPVFAELGWLSLLWPLVPFTGAAWLITLLVPFPIAGYMYLVVKGINRLSLRSSASLLTRGLAIALAVSVGVLIFLLLYMVQHWLDGQFHYRYMHGH